jgi:hypothetical protein
MGDCSDPTLSNYDAICQPNYSLYGPEKIAIDAPTSILSIASVPSLPAHADGSFLDGALVATGVALDDGLLPLGLASGLDQSPRDGLIDPSPHPFGDTSMSLSAGQIGIGTAPPHYGLEGATPFVMMIAMDKSELAGGVPHGMSVLLTRPSRFDPSLSAPGQFLELPGGTLNVANASFSATPQAATYLRLEMRQGRSGWIVWSPQPSFQLPNVAAARAALTPTSAVWIMASSIDTSYAARWVPGALQGFARTPAASSMVACGPAGQSSCVVQ